MPVGDSHVWTASDDYSIIVWDAHVRVHHPRCAVAPFATTMRSHDLRSFLSGEKETLTPRKR
jgi:hypothetical protein